MRNLVLAGLLILIVGCEDARRVEVERRNADYDRRQAAAQNLSPLLTPAPEPEKIDQLLACTPEKPGWPIDREACDRATARAEAAEKARLVPAQTDGVNAPDF